MRLFISVGKLIELNLWDEVMTVKHWSADDTKGIENDEEVELSQGQMKAIGLKVVSNG